MHRCRLASCAGVHEEVVKIGAERGRQLHLDFVELLPSQLVHVRGGQERSYAGPVRTVNELPDLLDSVVRAVTRRFVNLKKPF